MKVADTPFASGGNRVIPAVARALGGRYHATPPPFDIDTMKPIRTPWRAIKEWIPVESDDPQFWDQSRDSSWKPAEIPLGDDRILVFESN